MAYNFSKEEILRAFNTSKTICGAARLMGISYNAYARLSKKYGCYFPNKGGKGTKKTSSRTITKDTLNEVFENRRYISAYKLKYYLFKFSLKERKCEICGLKSWMDKDIPLELHHKNGNSYDNSWDNLQIICPNCHAQTEHYRGANKISHKSKIGNDKSDFKNKNSLMKPSNKNESLKICICCGENYYESKNKKFCSRNCMLTYMRKNIPSKEELLSNIKKFKSVVQLSNFYNLSDKAISKWIKKYDIDLSYYGYRVLNR